jgi:hypothetical protein
MILYIIIDYILYNIYIYIYYKKELESGVKSSHPLIPEYYKKYK